VRRLLNLAQLKRFSRDDGGIAAVEFALILPLLMTLYLGTVEAANLYSADRKVATVASTMADLVARVKNDLPQSDLDDYYEAAESIMQPYTTDGLSVVVSLLQLDEDGLATVTWSVGYGGGAARTADDDYPLAADTKINELARGASGWLVASEVSYPHQPLTGLVFPAAINLTHVEYFLPRFGLEIELDPDS
jgi:Flp pilus assembly protein TadG